MLKNIFTALLVLSAFAMAGCEPQYNHDQPDTTANRAGFQKHFGFPAPEANSNLYYYADALGADATYQLGFRADRDTVNQIVEKHGLVAADTKIDVPLGREFEWWVPDEIKATGVLEKNRGQRVLSLSMVFRGNQSRFLLGTQFVGCEPEYRHEQIGRAG